VSTFTSLSLFTVHVHICHSSVSTFTSLSPFSVHVHISVTLHCPRSHLCHPSLSTFTSLSLFTVHVELSTSIGSVWALSRPPSIVLIGQHSLKLTYITNKFLLPSYFSIRLIQIIPLKMEAVCSPETLEHISTMQCKTPKTAIIWICLLPHF